MIRLQRARIFLLAGLMVAGSLASAARAEAAGTGTKLAVANTSRIFNDMQETKDLKAKLEDRRKQVADEDKQRHDKIANMQAQLANSLRPGTPQYEKALVDVDKEMTDYESWTKFVRIQAERDQKNTMKMLFEKIQTAVGEVAKDQGIDLVLADQGAELPNLEAVNFDQLRAIINQRAVLYSSPKGDISDAVLTLLDAKYAKEKASPK